MVAPYNEVYMYRCPCSFNTMPQLINPSDEPVALQPWTRRFLLVTDLVNVQVMKTAEHFPYQGRSVQYR
ncbi:hypothetical protein TNCV_1291961 [Trichonephila clavipes]|nr:hypothetical protein TNCV_1291961 [Trichonephila clavipes]